MHKKQKLTVIEKESYKKLTSVLNTRVIATKLDIKQKVKDFERDFHKAQGTFPDQGSNPKYKELRKTLDHAKKLCQCWEDCVAL